MLLAIVLAVVIGVALGLLGGGGSILTVPLLVYGFGMETKAAIATSLLVVGIASLAALVQHARAGRVVWRTGLVFGAAGMAGAFAGGRVAVFIPPGVLLVLFAVMMLTTAVAMLRRPSPALEQNVRLRDGADVPTLAVVVEGLLVGVATGLVGAGGGFLIVPALVLLGGMSMPRAVATSLLVISMKSLAGFAGYLGHVQIDWAVGGILAAGAVGGTVVGSRLVRRISPDSLRRGFGWFTVAMASFILIQQGTGATLASLRTLAASPWPWILGTTFGLLGVLAYRARRRHA